MPGLRSGETIVDLYAAALELRELLQKRRVALLVAVVVLQHLGMAHTTRAAARQVGKSLQVLADLLQELPPSFDEC